MAKLVRVQKKAAEKKPTGTGVGVQKVVYGRVDFMLGQGKAHEEVGHAEIQEALKNFIEERWPNSRFTPSGGHYLIDGPEPGSRESCRFEDFDRKTMTRKPGTHPPSYTLAPGHAKRQAEEAEKILSARNKQQSGMENELGKQPENLLTSKEVDQAKSAPAAKKSVVVKKQKPAEPEPKPVKKTVRVRRAP